MSTTQRKYDVFLSFRGIDTRRNFVSYFYRELVRSNIRTFKDNKELESGRRISLELLHAIEQSRFAVVVVSVNYAASPWCLKELVKIMDLKENGLIEVLPIFYGVDPSHLRRQIGEVAEQFRFQEDPEEVLSWRHALTNLTNMIGYNSYHWEDDSEMIHEIIDSISKSLLGIDRHMEDLYKLLNLDSNESVRVFGIWARGGNSRSDLAKFVYESISLNFDSHFFIETPKDISQDQYMSHLREKFLKWNQPQISQDRHMPHPPEEFLKWNQQQISQDYHMPHLQEEFLIWIQGQGLTLVGSESQPVDQDRATVSQIKPTLRNQKVLLVAVDVNKLEQIDALAEDFNNFGPGSIVIITTQDKQLLNSANIKLVYDVDLPRFKIPEVRTLFRQLAFNKRDISATLFKEKKWLG